MNSLKKFVSRLTKTACAVVAVCAVSLAAQAGPSYITLIAGNQYTNPTVLMAGVTNQIGVTKGNTTNQFNTSLGSASASASSYLVSGSQINTNQWPLAAVSANAGFPQTLYGPFNNLALYNQFTIMATNANGTQTVPFRFAASVDGSNAATSWFVWQCSIAANQTSFVGITNIQTGGYPFIILQSVDNTNATAVTNNLLEAAGKPDL